MHCSFNRWNGRLTCLFQMTLERVYVVERKILPISLILLAKINPFKLKRSSFQRLICSYLIKMFRHDSRSLPDQLLQVSLTRKVGRVWKTIKMERKFLFRQLASFETIHIAITDVGCGRCFLSKK